MKAWMFLIGAALAVAPTPLRAQPNAAITITGQLASAPDSATIAVFEPQPGLALNYFFTNGANEAVVRGGRFSYQLQYGLVGFVRLLGQGAPQPWPSATPPPPSALKRASPRPPAPAWSCATRRPTTTS